MLGVDYTELRYVAINGRADVILLSARWAGPLYPDSDGRPRK
jgi:hypothetical protein